MNEMYYDTEYFFPVSPFSRWVSGRGCSHKYHNVKTTTHENTVYVGSSREFKQSRSLEDGHLYSVWQTRSSDSHSGLIHNEHHTHSYWRHTVRRNTTSVTERTLRLLRNFRSKSDVNCLVRPRLCVIHQTVTICEAAIPGIQRNTLLL